MEYEHVIEFRFINTNCSKKRSFHNFDALQHNYIHTIANNVSHSGVPPSNYFFLHIGFYLFSLHQL